MKLKLDFFFKKNVYFFLGLAILGAAVLANLFPDGYVFVGGDTPQFIEAKNNFRSYIYDNEGRASFFYAIFYVLDVFGLSNTGQLSFYLGIFLFGSYISFWTFSKLWFKEATSSSRMLVSLFYSLNLYTLFLFSGNWGYSYFPSLYIFIPLLAGLFLRFLETQNFVYASFFTLAAFLASPGFGNPAFFLSFLIFLALLLLLSVFFKLSRLTRSLILKVICLGLLVLLVNAYWMFPLIPRIESGVDGIFNSNVLEFNYVISSTASPILNTISLIHHSRDHFPYNFPYKNIEYLENIFIFISFLPIIFVSLGFVFFRKFEDEKRRQFLLFSGLLLVMIMLIARVTAPFETINHYIYNIWGMNTLRGFDKTAIFFPFILGSLMLMNLSELRSSKWPVAILAVILFIPLPFYLGKFQQTVGYRNKNGKNFRDISKSFLVKIPDEYYKIREVINGDKEKSFLATLPYSPADGSGISDYPKWKLYGLDITRYLYNKRFIEANGVYFDNWNFAKNFNEDSGGQNEWIARLLGTMNARYIIYHKDAPENSKKNSEQKIRSLENGGRLEKITENDYFMLYKIGDRNFVSYVSWGPKDVSLDEILNHEDIAGVFEKADFREINPRKFIANFDKKNYPYIFLAEPYDSNWKAYKITKDGEEAEINNHFKANGYANGWNIGGGAGESGTGQILIEYYPIRLMRKGLLVTLATVLSLLVYLLKCYYEQRKKIIQ